MQRCQGFEVRLAWRPIFLSRPSGLGFGLGALVLGLKVLVSASKFRPKFRVITKPVVLGGITITYSAKPPRFRCLPTDQQPRGTPEPLASVSLTRVVLLQLSRLLQSHCCNLYLFIVPLSVYTSELCSSRQSTVGT